VIAFLIATVAFGPGQATFIGVSDLKKTWTATGEEVRGFEWPDFPMLRQPEKSSSATIWFLASYVARSIDDEPSFAFRLPGNKPESASFTWRLKNKWRWSAGSGYPFSSGVRTTDIQFGFSNDPWKTVGAYRSPGGASTGLKFVTHISAEMPKTFGTQPKTGSGAKPEIYVNVEMPRRITENAFKVVAYGSNRKPLIPAGSMLLGDKRTFAFLGLRKDVKTIELQTRAYKWTSMKNVPLAPSQ
jgi:hypothetical protein